MTLKIRWQVVNKIPCAIAYDDMQNIILNELLDYSIYLSTTTNLSIITIKNEIQHLCLFYNICNIGKFSFYDTTDLTIRYFRDTDFDRLIKKSSSSERTLKRVINIRLVRIYRFLYWLAKQNKIVNFIGESNCQIFSSYDENEHRRRTSKKDYPLLFKNTGSNSKHATAYCATENDLEILTDYFLNNFSSYIAHRNILIMEIANQQGFRRASINSLTCTQFSIDEIDRYTEDTMFVNPPEQKFGASINYKFPILLAYRINSYINNFRANLLTSKGFHERDTGDRIFLSETTGRPLNHQTISEIFGDAFRATGKRWGRTAIHSFRRKFANNKIVDQTNSRLALGLDSSDASVSSAVSLELGQSDPNSIYSYVSRMQIELIHNHRAAVRDESEALVKENRDLKDQIAKLEAQARSKN